jgi:hypothetical protein
VEELRFVSLTKKMARGRDGVESDSDEKISSAESAHLQFRCSRIQIHGGCGTGQYVLDLMFFTIFILFSIHSLFALYFFCASHEIHG